MGAFDNFQPPVASGAFSNFQPPPAAGADPLLTQQPDEGWGGWALRHVHAASRAMDDMATFGLLDKGQGALDQAIGKGPTTAQLRADTNTAYATNPAAVNMGLGAATYALGPGELQGAGRIAGAVVPALGGRIAGALGSGVEGAAAGGLGAYGHDEDVGSGAGWGGLFGGALGGILGGVGRGKATAPVASPTAALEAAKNQAYAPLSNVLYDATKEVHPTLDVTDAKNALRDWSGYKWDDATKTRGEINTLLNKPQLSANDLQQSQSTLKGVAANPLSDPNDKLYAGHYAGKLQDVLDNATPQTGVPQNWTNPTNAPSFASQTKAEGDALFQRFKDSQRLDTMQAASQVNQGPDISSQARSYLTSKKGQAYAPPGSSQYDVFNALADTSNKGEYVPWWVKHYLVGPTLGAAVGGGIGAVTGGEEGHSPWTHALEDAVIGAGVGFGSGGYRGGTAAVNQAAQQRALDAARSTFRTGAPVAALGAPAPFRGAARNLLFGLGASGAN